MRDSGSRRQWAAATEGGGGARAGLSGRLGECRQQRGRRQISCHQAFNAVKLRPIMWVQSLPACFVGHYWLFPARCYVSPVHFMPTGCWGTRGRYRRGDGRAGSWGSCSVAGVVDRGTRPKESPHDGGGSLKRSRRGESGKIIRRCYVLVTCDT